MRRKLLSLLVPAVIALSSAGNVMPAFAEADSEVIVLYTNDVHCGIDDAVGYDGLMLYKREMQAQHDNVILVDAGDAIQGGNVGTFSKGAYITGLMNAVGYDVAVVGNHEFDFGMAELSKRSEELDCGYTCCNFKSLTTGENICDPYKIIEAGDMKIAFVGVITPETFSSSTPKYFQNEAGEYIYSFAEKEGELYQVVQDTVDLVIGEGADKVIVVGHLGETGITEKWSAPVLAANTQGIDAIIDGHSHETTPSMTVKNKAGEDVVITQTGTKLNNIGKMTITGDGITTELISEVPAPEGLEESTVTQRDGRYVDADINYLITRLNNKVSELLSEKVGYTDFGLYDCDPYTAERRVRNAETNLTDLLADVIRYTTGTDIAFMNGGGIRSRIKPGDITYADLLSVYPYGNKMVAARVTGQQILDMLELGVTNYPEEKGAFLSSVSGLEYTVDTSIESSVTENDYGEFTGVTGEYRVKNVLVGGEPLDLEKTYTVSTINYLLQDGGDGFIMSGKCEIIQDEGVSDIEMLADYIRNDLGGVIPEEYRDPEGQGRIRFTDGTQETSGPDSSEPDSSEPETSEPGTSESQSAPSEDTNPRTGAAAGIAAAAAVILAAVLIIRKKK